MARISFGALSLKRELKPITGAGTKFVALADEHYQSLAPEAASYDRAGTFPHNFVDAMKDSGYMAGPVPEELGGLGVLSAYDTALGTNRIARGDSSTANGTNMHTTLVWALTQAYLGGLRSGNDVSGLGTILAGVAAKEVTFCAAASEPGTDLLHPMTEARKNADGNWVLDGQKYFASLSPAATMFGCSVRVFRDDGTEGWGFATIPKGTPGLTINDDWDALGMRASGSHSLTLEGCIVPGPFVLDNRSTWGEWSIQFIRAFLGATLGITAVFLGIAEQADELIRASLIGKTKGPAKSRAVDKPLIQMQAAENYIELSAMYGMFERTGLAVDAYPGGGYDGSGLEQAHDAFVDVQALKTFVNAAAIRVVDRTLTMSGGGGYMTRNPLSRLYRDVRAGPFMQPLGVNEAHEYIGKWTLGVDP